MPDFTPRICRVSYRSLQHYVKNLLLYFHLVGDRTRDDDTERLLRYNIVPYFNRSQINSLKNLANKYGTSLFEIISSSKHMQEAKASKEQHERLQRHVEISTQSKPYNLINQLEQGLKALKDGPLTLLKDQTEKLESVESILKDFSSCTIEATVEEIQRHITFLDKHRGRSDLVLATVDYSKSQEFETAFLLGVDRVFDKRLYVSISRAKQRLFLVGDATAFANNKTLSRVPDKLFIRLHA
jgi:superfamily I DNA/RNA helicase